MVSNLGYSDISFSWASLAVKCQLMRAMADCGLLPMLSTHGGVYQYPLSSMKDIAVS